MRKLCDRLPNYMDFTLTEPLFAIDSRYTYLAPRINKVSADLETGYMGPGDFARVVVGKITSGFYAPPTDIWSGKGAFLAGVLEILNLNWVYDGLFAWLFGLNAKAPRNHSFK